MKVDFTGNLSFQNQLPRVLDRIREGKHPGLTALHLIDRQAGKEGVIFISDSRYVCGAVLSDIPYSPTEPPLLTGYEALRALLNLLMADFELLSEITKELPNPDLSLNIKLGQLITMFPKLPDNVSDLNVTLMDRVFENSTNTQMPAAVMDEYLTEAPTAATAPPNSALQPHDLPPSEYAAAYAHPPREQRYVSLQELAALEMRQGLLTMPEKLTAKEKMLAFINESVQLMRRNSAVLAVIVIVVAVFTVGSVYLKETRTHPASPEPVVKKPVKPPHKAKSGN